MRHLYFYGYFQFFCLIKKKEGMEGKKKMKLNPWGMVIDPGNAEQGDQDAGSIDLC